MGHELLPYTLSTWAFTLHVAGVRASDAAVVAACEAILAAGDATAGEGAATALLDRVRELFPTDEPEAVLAGARALYGDGVGDEIAQGDRDLRTARIRKYQFAAQLPWLARIWHREEGRVEPIWLVVERVTDQVLAADPNPWNDIDETRLWPLEDFHVLWELDGCTSLFVQPTRVEAGA
ncbi:MAG: hypothetical protein KC621_16765 [Myxococcales bacterium]|nr:hypothetical protein [Myxococcales bacterium]